MFTPQMSATRESYQTKMPAHALQKLWGKQGKRNQNKSESGKSLWQRPGAGDGGSADINCQARGLQLVESSNREFLM